MMMMMMMVVLGWRWEWYNDDGGVGEEVREMGLLLWLPDGEGRRRVEESEISGWIDRLTRSILELAGKIPPEKYSGGGAVVTAAGDGGGRRPVKWERERILKECVSGKTEKLSGMSFHIELL
ncbi:hypothetical protein Tco_0053929 [Tanacetum coccineum]